MGEIQQIFKTLMTLDSICDDKEEVEFLIGAFARYVSTHCSVEEISQGIGTGEDLTNFFNEYLDHLQYQL